MNSAFAHETIYPHLHPHAEVSASSDFFYSILWLGGMALFVYLAIRLIAYVRRRS